MNETNTIKSLSIKVLAIIGFFATGVLIAWLFVFVIKIAPSAFSSLASIAESIQSYHPINEISIATENSVVNSSESFQVSWTDMKQAGEYHFTYICTPGVTLSVRDGDGLLAPIKCTDILTLPATAHGIFVTITSDEIRLTDVPLKVTFTNPEKNISLSSEMKITVVNATIPVREEFPTVVTPVVTPEPEKTESALEPVVVTTPEPQPTSTPRPKAPTMTTTVVYPQSNPNGFTDLKVTTLGSGILKNGVFTYTAKYDRDLRNAIKFDIKNIGTKTSGSWTFKTLLPSGVVYESPVQIPLKPMEHVEFTLGFDLEDNSKDLVKITNTVYTKNDTNTKNNSAVWHVVVQD